MKRLFALLLAGVILLSACGGESPNGESPGGVPDTPAETPPEITAQPMPALTPASEPTPAPLTPTPEPVYDLDFVNDEAEELFNTIMANRHVWEPKEEYVSIYGGTLLDLDFDGVPEFLLMHGGRQLSVFKIENGELKEIAEIRGLGFSMQSMQALALHIDEDGNKSWMINYDAYNEDSYNWEYRTSLFDFTGDQVTEHVKFMYRSDTDTWLRTSQTDNLDAEADPDAPPAAYFDEFYGYHIRGYYIDGERFHAPDAEMEQFVEELREVIRQAEEAAAAAVAEDEDTFMDSAGWFLPWACAPLSVFPNPVEIRWNALRDAFIESLELPAYRLFPNVGDLGFRNNTYVSPHSPETAWYLYGENRAHYALNELVNAYFSGDDDYFQTDIILYDSDGAMCKPVIYLYPEEITDVEVRVTFPRGGYFTATYPDYGAGWSVTAHPDGTLINHADGREYSYLYWAGNGPANWDFSRGFVVKGSDTVPFLQEKLAQIGLTPREYNEMIVYYLPLMQNNAYNLISFQTTVYEENAVMHISPEPDSVLRVFMAYVPLEKPPATPIPEQKLKPFERKGFTVVEWGGTGY